MGRKKVFSNRKKQNAIRRSKQINLHQTAVCNHLAPSGNNSITCLVEHGNGGMLDPIEIILISDRVQVTANNLKNANYHPVGACRLQLMLKTSFVILEHSQAQ